MCVQRPLVEDWRWCHIRLAIKARYLGNHASQIKSYYGTLSGNHGRAFRIRHLKQRAEKWHWRHIRLAIKPCNLGNHASQIKSYYGTLWGSHGRSFRIRHLKQREATPRGEITMTSYPVGDKTSLFRKPCIPDKQLLWNAMRKSWSLLQNPSWQCTRERINIASWCHIVNLNYLALFLNTAFYNKVYGCTRRWRLSDTLGSEAPHN